MTQRRVVEEPLWTTAANLAEPTGPETGKDPNSTAYNLFSTS